MVSFSDKIDRETLEKRIVAYLKRTEPDFRDEEYDSILGPSGPSMRPLIFDLGRVATWYIKGGLEEDGEQKPGYLWLVRGTYLQAVSFLVQQDTYVGHGCTADQSTNRNGHVSLAEIKELPEARVSFSTIEKMMKEK